MHNITPMQRDATAQACCSCSARAELRAPRCFRSRSDLPVLAAQRRTRKLRKQQDVIVMSAAALALDLGSVSAFSPDSYQSLRAISTCIGLALGAIFWVSQSQPQKDSSLQECSSCGGRGVVECRLCNRWSDGDNRGCIGCGGSGQMTCPSCGGGGMAVPIKAKMYIQPNRKVDLQ